ncbi:MAG: fibronectin type III domain-containing protein, partial [Muribaculaceae bacterium]|nr:fibronectin type III domain-containing protein [Muribaculaceae bacterium]
FEGTTCGWELINGTCQDAWVWGTATSNGGTHALYISDNGGTSWNYSHNSVKVLAAKLLSFTDGKFEFSYDWNCYGESNYDFLRVALVPASQTLTAGSDYGTITTTSLPTGWIALDGGGKLNQVQTWQNKIVAVNVTAGNYYLVLAWRSDTSTQNQPPAAVDNVSITRMACEYDVTGLAVDDITTNSATLVWNNSEVGQWQVAYADNASFENATEVTVSDTTYTMTGLQPATAYYAKVRAYCGGEDFGAWSTTISFLTECVAITSFPWTENFDSYTAASGFLPVCWNRINTGTSYYTWPCVSSSNSHSTSNCLYFYSYGSSSSTNISDQYAILPIMENLAGKQINLFARGYNNQSTFTIGTMTNPTDVTTFTAIATQELTTTYQEFIYFVPASTTDNYLAIMMERPNATSGVTRGVYIDDITINLPPACPKPTVLTVGEVTAHTAQLSWTSDADAWQVMVNNDTINAIDVTTNPYILEGLQDGMSYTVTVRANCDVDGYSEWSNNATFTTPIACPAPTG